MSNTTNPKTRTETSQELRDLNIGFRDKLILNDGRAVQVIEALDGIVKVIGAAGVNFYVRRDQIRNHYPYVTQ
ncbi:MAG: hypothetical protein JO001_05870 [Alphaproteobacteria bacterium]|nr:hypothetical protein [Alphaproteobacteria bacterium]